MDEARIRQRVAAARRIVVKAGTNVIMRDDGAVALGRLYGLIESVASLKKQGRHVLIVSSGAVGLGAQRLRLEKKPGSLTLKQACAAIGQSRLMSVYEEGFEKMGLLTAQVLLTEDDFTDRTRFQNLSATLEKLFELDAVPILNENDTVSTLELESPDGKGVRGLFGDNDRLSALVMSKVRADVLVILSDVDGLFTGNPAHDRTATLIPLVREITEEIARHADGGSGRGRGGMASKLDAARIATGSGGVAVIANGRTPGVLDRLFAGEAVGHRLRSEGRDERSMTDEGGEQEEGDFLEGNMGPVEIAKRARVAARSLASLSSETKELILLKVADGIDAARDVILDANRVDVDSRPHHFRRNLSLGVCPRTPDARRDQGARHGRRHSCRRRSSRPLRPRPVAHAPRRRPRPGEGDVSPGRPPRHLRVAPRRGGADRLAGAQVGQRGDPQGRARIRPLHGGAPRRLREGARVLPRDPRRRALLRGGPGRGGRAPRARRVTSTSSSRGAATTSSSTSRRITRIPVLGHAEGVCHVYVDRAADEAMATAIVLDSKLQYAAACNAIETLLVHRDAAGRFLVPLLDRLLEAGVEIRACEETRALAPSLVLAPVTEEDWRMEYGARSCP